jgi:hypothetical protein
MARVDGKSGLMLVVLAGISFGTACGYRKLGPDSGMEAGADGGGTDHVAAADSGIDSRIVDGRAADSIIDIVADAVADHAALVDVGGGTDVAIAVDAPPDRPSDSTPADAPRDNVPDRGIAIDSGPPQLGNGSPCQTNPQCLSNNCSGSVCCAAGQSGCTGSCVALATDNSNCGACGRPCTLGQQTCTNGTCRANDGKPCAMPSDCASGICGHWRIDGDRDGYGTGDPVGICGAASPPPGFSAVSGDCCDSNAAVNPGVTDFQPAAAPACPGGSMVSPWDWNCNGVIDADLQHISDCGVPPACTATFSPFPDSSCGDPNAAPQMCVVDAPGPPITPFCQAVQGGLTEAMRFAVGGGGLGVLGCM